MRREAARGNLEIIPFFNRMVEDIWSMMESVPQDIDGFKIKQFYITLWEMAKIVRKDSFHGLQDDPNWNREI